MSVQPIKPVSFGRTRYTAEQFAELSDKQLHVLARKSNKIKLKPMPI